VNSFVGEHGTRRRPPKARQRGERSASTDPL
jgi:hypothetical protein